MSYYAKLPQIDRTIIEQVIDDAVAQGFEISVFDCEEITLRRSTDKAAITAALCTTDDDHLYFYRPGVKERQGWAWLIYGNEPGVVLSDSTLDNGVEEITKRAYETALNYED